MKSIAIELCELPHRQLGRTGKEKENPYNIFNRIVTESRKYGMGLIIVSQRPSHFPQEVLANTFTKIILKTNSNDYKDAIKNLGIKNKELLKTADNFGYALVSKGGKDYRTTVLPWAVKM